GPAREHPPVVAVDRAVDHARPCEGFTKRNAERCIQERPEVRDSVTLQNQPPAIAENEPPPLQRLLEGPSVAPHPDDVQILQVHRASSKGVQEGADPDLKMPRPPDAKDGSLAD